MEIRGLTPLMNQDAGAGAGGDGAGGDAGKTKPNPNDAPLFTQSELDEAIDRRLAREKSKWERMSGVSNQEREELDRLRKKDKETETKRAEAEGDWKRLEVSLREDYETKLKEKETKLTKAETELKTERVRRAIIAEAAKLDAYDPEDIADMLERRLTLDEHYQAIVLDEQGKRAYAPGGKDLTVDLLVKQTLEKKPHLVKAGNTGGGGGSRGGASTSGEGGGRINPKIQEQEAEIAKLQEAAKQGDTIANAKLLRATRELEALRKAG